MPIDSRPCYQDFQHPRQATPGSGRLYGNFEGGSDHSSLMNQYQILNQEEHASIFSHNKFFNGSRDPLAQSSQFNSLQDRDRHPEELTPIKKSLPKHIE